MRPLPISATLAVLACTACAGPPDLPAGIAPGVERAPIPALQPLAPILAAGDALARGPDAAAPGAEAAPDVETRAAQLRARAEALRAPVIGDDTRARFRAGVTLPAILRD